ncbi:MAG: IclR family transcriptional regulator [Stappiaceae bacterium]
MDKAVVKAFRLIEILSRNEGPMGVTALAQAADLGKSNVHRLLQTLLELGYVQSSGDGAYEASLKMWELGCHVFSRLSIRDIARPFMRALSDVTSETVHLSELDRWEVLYIDKIESSEPVRAYTQLGGRAPAYCTATGKAMLAYQDAEDLAECFETAKSYTPKTISNFDRFLDEAQQIRARRYAVNRGEWRADIVGLASPLANSEGMVCGAIGISGPASRLDPAELETIAPRIVGYAEQISAAMGCSEPLWAMLGAEENGGNTGSHLKSQSI